MTHLITFGPEGPRVQSCTSTEVIPQAINGNRAIKVAEPNDLKAMTKAELAELCNHLQPGEPVRSFKTKGAGVARAWGLLEQEPAPAQQAPAAPKARAPLKQGMVYKLKEFVLEDPAIKDAELLAKLKTAGIDASPSSVAAFRGDFIHSLRFLKARGYDVPVEA